MRRKWLDETAFADLIALCQFLPGPLSSQVGLAIGMHRAGWLGALAAWVGFTLPSALLMIGFGYGIGFLGNVQHAGWLEGLKLAALAVVAQAVWSMGSKFCSERATASIAVGAAIAVLIWTAGFAQLVVLAAGSLLGWLLFGEEAGAGSKSGSSGEGNLSIPYSRRVGGVLLAIFFVLLLGLPTLNIWVRADALTTFNAFYRTGSLVFGGGHVVLPLLQAAAVDPGWVSNDTFLAGYGAVQAVPGPLFTFAAFLGTVMSQQPNGWIGGGWCLLGIYVPAALLVFGSLPYWEFLRREPTSRALLKGANASVVGLLLAALYQPLWTTTVHHPIDFCIAMAAYLLIEIWKIPPWIVVGLSALAGALLYSGLAAAD